MENNKKIIEINGVKLEVDLSQATVISNYKIGDNVKILIKDYSRYTSYPGVIIGFDNFKEHPAINIAYLDAEYSTASIKFKTITSESTDVEICPVTNISEITFRKDRVIDLMDREILKKEEELLSLQRQKKYFVEKFNKYFEKEV